MTPDNLFFTSDTHFGHRLMVGPRVSRPFADIDEMDAQLIVAWNRVVPFDGTVYHLGDVSFRGATATRAILAQLNGVICLVRGNHDHMSAETKKRFEWIKDYYELDVELPAGKQRIVMFHFPIRVWHRNHQGSWHVHGHSHGNMPAIGRMLDVGLDSKGDGIAPHMRPWSFAEVADYMSRREFAGEDHHTEAAR